MLWSHFFSTVGEKVCGAIESLNLKKKEDNLEVFDSRSTPNHTIVYIQKYFSTKFSSHSNQSTTSYLHSILVE